MSERILIVDYGMGNLRSVFNKFKQTGVECLVSSKKEDIYSADKIILPGVGHFKFGMKNLQELNLIDVLNKKVIENKTPILGICLGTQLFCKHSEEGITAGLGWLDAEVVRFKVSNKLKYKVPHMGWNDVQIKNSNFLDKDMGADEKFYFVHSFHLICNKPEDIWMTTEYDYEFVSAVHKENIYGTQFHPEKSHDAGIKLLQKFAEL